MRRNTRLALLLAFVAPGGCGDSSSPATPSQPSLPNIAGAWSGNASDSTSPISSVVNWTLTQNGGDINGSMSAASGGLLNVSATVTGTLTGSTLNFRISVPPGGVNLAPDCTSEISGSANDVTANRIAGVYNGTSTCTGPITDGMIALAR